MSATTNSSLRSVSQKSGNNRMNRTSKANDKRESEQAEIRRKNMKTLENLNKETRRAALRDVEDPNKAKARETYWLVGKVTFGSVLIFCLALFIVANLGVSIG